jgi:hypothetical protein
MKNILCFLLIIVFFTPCLTAQEEEKKSEKVPKRIYTTKYLGQETAPVIDGLLDDSSWNIVEWTGDYIENQPDENTPPSEQTQFKIIYDKKNLYIGVRAFDSQPDSIVRRLSRRDGFAGDWVEFNIDSYHDLRTAFSFTITAAGVKGDEFITNNGNNWDGSWNPIWYAKTNIDDKGWTAEIRIPLSQLRFDKDKNQIWGLQSTRRFFRKEERSLWQRKPQDAPGWVSEFGELHGLIDLEPQRQLEIQPFTVLQYDKFPKEEGNPFRDGTDFKLNGGLDAKIGITNDLTLDLTMNPDFGQVEADPAAIALDGFEIFFNEQRPFFVENNNIFNYRISQSNAGNTFGSDNLFFSRRIGRSPQGFPETEDGEFVNQPTNTTILGAAKFSGKTKNGWSIGVLESVTAKEYAEIDNNGERREELVEPLTNYFVGRLQKDFNEQKTFVGGIFTATNRDLPSHLAFLHKSAYTGGLDFKHQWKDRAWYVGGDIVFSHVQGTKEAIQNTQESQRHLFGRVDASHLEVDPNRTSLTGSGGNIQIGKAANGHWRFESGFTWRSPELEVNDLGFQRQADDLRHYTWIGYRSLKPFSIFRSLGLNYNHWAAWDFEGNHNQLQWNVNSWANFKNNWFGNIGFNYKPIRHSISALRGGPRLRGSQNFNYWNSIGTDNRKKIRFNLNHNYGKAFDNSFNFFNVDFSVSYQPTNALRISVNPEYSINNDKLQFVENVEFGSETRYINAMIKQRTLSMSVRINYTINPNLSIQYYGQPFISRGRYMDYKFITAAQANNFEDRFQEYNNTQLTLDDESGVYSVDENFNGTTDYSFDKPDFSFVQFRSNLVVRWEYIPGSEIFLVWSQGVTGSGNPDDGLFTGLDNQILGQEKNNTFLIKATYRFRR